MFNAGITTAMPLYPPRRVGRPCSVVLELRGCLLALSRRLLELELPTAALILARSHVRLYRKAVIPKRKSERNSNQAHKLESAVGC